MFPNDDRLWRGKCFDVHSSSEDKNIAKVIEKKIDTSGSQFMNVGIIDKVKIDYFLCVK